MFAFISGRQLLWKENCWPTSTRSRWQKEMTCRNPAIAVWMGIVLLDVAVKSQQSSSTWRSTFLSKYNKTTKRRRASSLPKWKKRKKLIFLFVSFLFFFCFVFCCCWSCCGCCSIAAAALSSELKLTIQANPNRRKESKKKPKQKKQGERERAHYPADTHTTARHGQDHHITRVYTETFWLYIDEEELQQQPSARYTIARVDGLESPLRV